MEGGGSFYSDSKAMACVCGGVGERKREREEGGQSADSEVMGCLSSLLSHSRTCQSCRLTARAGSPLTCLPTPTNSLKVPLSLSLLA